MHHYENARRDSPNVYETLGGCYALTYMRSGGQVGKEHSSMDAEDCQNSCLYTSGCAHFVFFRDDKVCRLYTDCSVKEPAGETQVIAGPLSCHIDWKPVPCKAVSDYDANAPSPANDPSPANGPSNDNGPSTTNANGPPKTEPETSPVTGIDYKKISSLEWKVFERLNQVRKQGFSCPGGGGCVKANGCGRYDLQFDCRLWTASKRHAEDMVKRNYYSHKTLSADPSVARQSLDLTQPNLNY